MALTNKGGDGYCVTCKSMIIQDNNKPQCKECLKSVIASSDNEIYCHICGEKTFSCLIYYPRCRTCRGLNREGEKYDDELYLKWLNKYTKDGALDNIRALWNLEQDIITNNIYSELDINKLVDITGLNRKFDLGKILYYDSRSNCRILNILERWSRNLYVDPPTLYKSHGQYNFLDGQHRTIAAYLIGEQSVPINIKHAII